MFTSTKFVVTSWSTRWTTNSSSSTTSTNAKAIVKVSLLMLMLHYYQYQSTKYPGFEVISEKILNDEVRYEPVAEDNWFNLVSCAACSDVIEPVCAESWFNCSCAACSCNRTSLTNWFNLTCWLISRWTSICIKSWYTTKNNLWWTTYYSTN